MTEKLTTLAKRLRPFFAGQVQAMAGASVLMTEGPDIDIVGQTIGRGGDTILLFDSGGNPVAEYPATSAGLVNALAAATAGDTVQVPSVTITGGPWTVAASITLCGMSNSNSIIAGDVTNNGHIRTLRINGNITNTGLIEYCTLYSTTGNTYTAGINGSLYWSLVLYSGGNDMNYAIYIPSTATDSHVNHCTTGTVSGSNTGLFSDCTAFDLTDCYINGYTAAVINNIRNASNCLFISQLAGVDGVRHDSGTAFFRNCGFDSLGSGVGLNLQAAGCTLIDCGWDSITNASNITYGTGDRGAYSVEDYHASDIEAGVLTRHAPLASASSGGFLVSDGTAWVSAHPVVYEGDVVTNNGEIIWVT